MEFFKDELSDSYTQTYQKKAAFQWLIIFLSGAIISGWVIGTTGLSVAWLMVLMITLAIIWSSKLVYLIEDAKNEEIMKARRRKALSKDETAEWLNILINRWWILSSKSIFQITRERLEPLLNEAKPSFLEKIELKEFSFGDQTPCVKSIKTFDIVDGKRNSYNRFFPVVSQVKNEYKIALEIDLYLNSEEFRLLLRTRLFGKGTGMNVDIAIEKLNICGKLELLLTVDLNSPFPHISDISIMFVEKPQVWFSIRMLKVVQMMEIPILKTWIYSAVMDVLETAIVDPEKLHITLFENEYVPGIIEGVSAAQGVLIVSFSTSEYNLSDQSSTWMSLKIGNQCFKSSKISSNWNESSSFLIESLQTDKLVIKLKSKKLISNVKLAKYEMVLNEYNLENAETVETVLQKKSPKEHQVPNISVRLEFSKLPKVSSENLQFRSLDSTIVSGVLTVVIHSAKGLVFSDPHHCNSYCMLFNNKRKIFTTPCVDNTASPQWESRCQILVSDYTQTTLSFVVCSSWSSKKFSNDEMLGVANFSIAQGETLIQNRQLSLSSSSNSTSSIVVSVIFQPVKKMAEVNSGAPSSGSEIDSRSDSSSGKSKNTYSFQKHKATSIMAGDEDVQRGLSVSQILTYGDGLMEVSLLQARDLISLDLSRLNDSFCELKVNGECKYKSSIKKKTMNPVWEESVILGVPRVGETFDILVWDQNVFGKNEFLGSIVLSLDEIQELSSSDSAKWFPLQGVRSGTIELKIKKISEITAAEDNSPKPVFRENLLEKSPFSRRSPKERSQVKLGISIPPPIPPRTVSVPHRRHFGKDKDSDNLSFEYSSFHSDNSDSSAYSSFQSLSNAVPRTNVPKEKSSLTKTDFETPQDTATPESDFTDGLMRKQIDIEPNPFRSMKEKFTRSLRLRRFKSEVNVRQNKMDIKVKDDNSTNFRDQGSLSHATSQPNIRNGKNEVIRPTELNVNPMARPDKYTGVEGKVIQAQGLHVAHVAQLYCRIKLLGIQSNEKNSKHTLNSNGKTLAKSHFLPAVPNPQFDLSFQINSPDSIPRQALLLFEIRSSGKEVVAVRKVALQDLLSNEGKETHTWLALSNGATLEVIVAHGKELKKQTKKLFRSWSVHRIGKV